MVGTFTVIAWAFSSGSTRRTQGGDFFMAMDTRQLHRKLHLHNLIGIHRLTVEIINDVYFYSRCTRHTQLLELIDTTHTSWLAVLSIGAVLTGQRNQRRRTAAHHRMN